MLSIFWHFIFHQNSPLARASQSDAKISCPIILFSPHLILLTTSWTSLTSSCRNCSVVDSCSCCGRNHTQQSPVDYRAKISLICLISADYLAWESILAGVLHQVPDQTPLSWWTGRIPPSRSCRSCRSCTWWRSYHGSLTKTCKSVSNKGTTIPTNVSITWSPRFCCRRILPLFLPLWSLPRPSWLWRDGGRWGGGWWPGWRTLCCDGYQGLLSSYSPPLTASPLLRLELRQVSHQRKTWSIIQTIISRYHGTVRHFSQKFGKAILANEIFMSFIS